jgi:hypothetical protein
VLLFKFFENCENAETTVMSIDRNFIGVSNIINKNVNDSKLEVFVLSYVNA